MGVADKTESPEVEPFDTGRFYVLSRTNPKDRYLVDILAHSGWGSCECWDWASRCGPARKAGIIPQKPWCWHIQKAREAFTWDVIHRMLANEKAQEAAGAAS